MVQMNLERGFRDRKPSCPLCCAFYILVALQSITQDDQIICKIIAGCPLTKVMMITCAMIIRFTSMHTHVVGQIILSCFFFIGSVG